jgi:hypothetical protein
MMGRTVLGATAVTSILTLGACGGAATVSPVTQPTSVKYVATLSGTNESPAVSTAATGSAVYTLTGNILTYTLTVNNLTATATSSHIHAAPAGSNGSVIVPFVTAPVGSGVVTSGSIDLSQPISNGTTSISGDSLRTLLNSGGAYTNVHTSQFKGGEIRGQILKQ